MCMLFVPGLFDTAASDVASTYGVHGGLCDGVAMMIMTGTGTGLVLVLGLLGLPLFPDCQISVRHSEFAGVAGPIKIYCTFTFCFTYA